MSEQEVIAYERWFNVYSSGNKPPRDFAQLDDAIAYAREQLQEAWRSVTIYVVDRPVAPR